MTIEQEAAAYRALLDKVRAQKPSAEWLAGCHEAHCKIVKRAVNLHIADDAEPLPVCNCDHRDRLARVESERLVAAIEQERLLAALREARSYFGPCDARAQAINTAIDSAPPSSAELAELRAKAARLDALNAEAAQILPTPKQVVQRLRDTVPTAMYGFVKALDRYLLEAFAERDLLHLSRRDAGFAALRAALGKLLGAAESFTGMVEGESPSLVENDHNHQAICEAMESARGAYSATEPGAALGTVIEALKLGAFEGGAVARAQILVALSALGVQP